MSARYCAECGEAMQTGGRCSCGWYDTTSTVWGHDCAYRDGARKCPAPGGMSFSIKGNSPWYCEPHFRNIHDREACKKILDDYDANGVPKADNWRDEMLNARMTFKHGA